MRFAGGKYMETSGAYDYILDTVALRVMAFARPDGIAIMLRTLAAASARFPAEVYNQDEALLPADSPDDSELSELARGLRFAKRQVTSLPPASASRFANSLQNAQQLSHHIAQATLVIDPLMTNELPLRESYRATYALGRGEAACLVLAHRYGAGVVFVSSDEPACRVARALGVTYVTLPNIVMSWAAQETPSHTELDNLIAGMRAAKFGLKQTVIDQLFARAAPDME